MSWDAQGVDIRQRLCMDGGFEIQGDSFSVSEVLDILTPFVEEKRLERLGDVVDKRTFRVATVLEDIYDRGNISAVMRSAEAFGFIDFHVIEKEGARFKNSNRVSKGTEKWMDIHKYSSSVDCVKHLKSRGFKIYCTHLDSSQSIDSIDFTSQPTAIVLGNEKEGVSREMVEMADGNFILPMQGFAQSFNISVAGALTLYHIHQQYLHQNKQRGLLDREKEALLANYILRSVASSEKILLQSRSK